MISLVYDVLAYRQLLVDTVKDGDVVVEIGPHMGSSTLGYVKKAKLVIAVDKSQEAFDSFQPLLKDHGNLKFIKDDTRGFDAVKKVLEYTKKCDVLAVDLGGGRFSDTVYKVWATWSGILKPRDSIIRSRALAEFMQRARIQDDSIKQEFNDDGWLSSWGRATPHDLKKQLDEFKYYVDINKSIKK